MAVVQDISYGSSGTRELKLDTYTPKSGVTSTRTAIILVHGGGWMTGAKGMVFPLATALARKGFVVVAPEYRLIPEAAWPAQIDDVTAAVRWVASQSEQLGINRERIVLAGGSAGGHLALLATAKLQGEVPIAAILSLFSASSLSVGRERPEKGSFDASMLVGADADADALRAANPIEQINAEFPPVFLLHGSVDWLIDPVASVHLYEKLVELGVTTELHIVARANHEFIGEPRMIEPMVSEITLFLDRVLLDPGTWDQEALESNLFAKGPEAFRAMMEKMARQPA